MTAREKDNGGWPESECRRALEQAADSIEDPLTVERYREWNRSESGLRPSGGAIRNQLGGSWRDALEAVGIESHAGEVLAWEWSEEEAREAVSMISWLECVSYSQYAELASETRRIPTAPVLYRWVDSWSEVPEWASGGGSE
jgi:hypothetical protein